MANALFDPGREGILDETIGMSSGDIRCMLVKSTYTFSAAHKSSSPIWARSTTAAAPRSRPRPSPRGLRRRHRNLTATAAAASNALVIFDRQRRPRGNFAHQRPAVHAGRVPDGQHHLGAQDLQAWEHHHGRRPVLQRPARGLHRHRHRVGHPTLDHRQGALPREQLPRARRGTSRASARRCASGCSAASPRRRRRNGTFDVYYGTGADANGTILGRRRALTASQTNLGWMAEIDLSLHRLDRHALLTGYAMFNNAVLANTAPMLIGLGAGGVWQHRTAANIISAAQRSTARRCRCTTCRSSR